MENITICDVLGWEEGYSLKPYYCSEGYPTIGKGTRIGPKDAPLGLYQLEFSEQVADAYLSEDVSDITHKLNDKFSWFSELTQSRQIALISMAYQMGFNGLCKFRNMLNDLSDGNPVMASAEALDSRWAKQSPNRASRHARLIAGKQLSEVYSDYL